MNLTHFACAQRELRRLASLRRHARAQGRIRAVAEYDREINTLLLLSWPCGEPGCDDRVTLGMYAAQQMEEAH